MASGFDGVMLKFDRANEHLKAIEAIQSTLRYQKVRLVPEDDADSDYIAFRLRLPPIPDNFVTIVGDCIHNLRCVLDHIVWDLAVVADAETALVNRKKILFPICETPGEYAAAIKRGRLTAVPMEAATLVEAAQPYQAGYELMAILNELENIDKHRTLVFVESFTRGLSAWDVPSTTVSFFSFGGEHDDGAICLRVAKSAVTARMIGFGKVDMEANGSVLIAFKDGPAQGWYVGQLLRSLSSLFAEEIIPTFKPLLS